MRIYIYEAAVAHPFARRVVLSGLSVANDDFTTRGEPACPKHASASSSACPSQAAAVETGSRRATSSLSARRKLAAVFASSRRRRFGIKKKERERRKEKKKKKKKKREGRQRAESGTLGASSGWSNYPTVSRSRAARAGPG